MRSIAPDKHPKDLYTRCLGNNNYWRHYANNSKLTVDDLSMILCKDIGCDLNYCGLIKVRRVPKFQLLCRNQFLATGRAAQTALMSTRCSLSAWHGKDAGGHGMIMAIWRCMIIYRLSLRSKRKKSVTNMFLIWVGEVVQTCIEIPATGLTEEEQIKRTREKMEHSYM